MRRRPLLAWLSRIPIAVASGTINRCWPARPLAGEYHSFSGVTEPISDPSVQLPGLFGPTSLASPHQESNPSLLDDCPKLRIDAPPRGVDQFKPKYSLTFKFYAIFKALEPFLKDHGNEMAPLGQAASHALHSKQSSGLATSAFSLIMSKTFAGQTSAHLPQPSHFFTSTSGGKTNHLLFAVE